MCDTFVLLPEYTKNNKFYFAKNSDRDPNEAHEVIIVPAKEHKVGELLQCTYISIPQVGKTNKVLLAKPVWIWGAEMGVNEFGVVIGNEAVFSKIPAGKEPGLIGMDYLRLGLERGSTAREALNVITSLLEEFGQSGNCGFMHPFYYHNSFLIADKNEAWKLETVEKHWIAEKINGFGAISNGYSIEENYDLISPELISTAREKGWLKNGGPFNFRNSYSDWLFTNFSDSKQRQSCSITKINKKGSETKLKDIFEVLRSHRDEETFRPDRGIVGADLCMHAGFGPVRVSQTTGSMVVEQSEDNLIVWVTGSAAPCLSVFKPIILDGVTSYFGPKPQVNYDPFSYWWQQERIHRIINQNYKELGKKYKSERDVLEDGYLKRMDEFDGDKSKITKCFDEAFAFQELWIEKLSNLNSSNKNNILYQIAWNNNNRLAQMPK